MAFDIQRTKRAVRNLYESLFAACNSCPVFAEHMTVELTVEALTDHASMVTWPEDEISMARGSTWLQCSQLKTSFLQAFDGMFMVVPVRLVGVDATKLSTAWTSINHNDALAFINTSCSSSVTMVWFHVGLAGCDDNGTPSEIHSRIDCLMIETARDAAQFKLRFL